MNYTFVFEVSYNMPSLDEFPHQGYEICCLHQIFLVEQIQVTVRHEIGHHLGLSEDDLERLGLG